MIRRLCYIFLFPAALVILLLALAGPVHGTQKLRMGVFIMDPMVTRDKDGRFHGAVVEVAEHIAGLEGWDLQIVECEFATCLSMLESGAIDLTSPIALTKERAQKYSFTDETLLMDWGQIYVHADLDVRTILDLDGKRLVTLEKTVFNSSIFKLLKSFDISVRRLDVPDYMDVFRYVEEGKADAMVINRLFGEKNIGKFKHVKKTPIIFQPLDIRFATPKGKRADIRAALDRRLSELKADHSSKYYVAINRMLGSGIPEFHVPHWVWWATAGSGGALTILLALSVAFKHQVNVRTEELRKENEERRKAKRALFESRESFKTLVEFTAAIHFELDLATREFVYVSPQALSMLGYPIDSWTGIDFWASIIHPEDRQWTVDFCLSETEKGNDHELMYRVIDSGGRTVWLRDIVKVIIGPGGPEKLIGIMFDITGEKQREEMLAASLREKEVLLREIHHRVKNNMSVISSLSSLQANYVTDEEALRILKEGRNRIRAMALVHEQLYQSESLSKIDVKSYLEQLVENMARSYNVKAREKIRVETDVDCLNIDTLIPCGLVINELLTNSLKYAYDSPGGGEVSVCLKKQGDDTLLLRVSDRGKGFPEGVEFENRNTLGLKLVSTLAAQLEGELSIRGDGGVSVEIAFNYL